MCWGRVPADEGGVRPHAIAALEGVVDIAAGDDVLCGRRPAGEVVCLGTSGDALLGPNDAPATIEALAGARSLAVVGSGIGVRICAIVESAIVCMPTFGFGTSTQRIEGAAAGAILRAVGRAVCVIDGALPARCANGAEPLWELGGTVGAIDLTQARGVCAVLAGGTLACAEGALGSAALAPVGPVDARGVAGNELTRCVSSARGLDCETRDEAPVHVAGDDVAVAVGSAHACARAASGAVSCFGNNTWGQAAPPAVEVLARRIDGAPPDLVDVAPAWTGAHVVDGAGRSFRVPLGGGAVEPVAELPRLAHLAFTEQLWGTTPEGDLLPVSGRWDGPLRFRALGAPFSTRYLVCAAVRAGVACVHSRHAASVEPPRGAVVTIPGLSGAVEPFARGNDVCGRVGTSVRCANAVYMPERRPERATELRGLPPVAHVLGGAEQIFLQDTSGSWLAMGHNGAGQLGLTPSRPLGPTPVTLPVTEPGVRAAFTTHASCVWAPGSALHCAGLDAQLRIRSVSRASAPAARGEGGFREIPGPRDLRAVSLHEAGSFAIDGGGALWTWGGSEALDVVARIDVPAAVVLPDP